MQRRSSSSMLTGGAIAGGAGFVAFVASMIVGGVTLPPALFLALVVAAAIGALFLLGRPKGGTSRSEASPASQSEPPRTEPGTIGVPVTEATPGTLAAEPAVEPRSDPDTDRAPIASVGAASPQGTAASAAVAGTTSSDTETGDSADSAPSAVSEELPDTDILPSPAHDSGAHHEASDGGEDSDVSTDETVSAERDDDDDQAEEAPTDAVGRPPARLESPRDGGADDLKQIRGVGPKLEETLNGIGIFHIDQIAGWNAEELAWIDEHLEGFRGRAGRDDWVAQARDLTETSN